MTSLLLENSHDRRVAFTDPVFGKDIYWYGIIIAVALIIGVVLGVREAKRRGYRAEMVLDFMLIAIPVSIVCARLYYVIFATDQVTGINPYWINPVKIIAIWEGGLAIYGAVIGGVISALIFYRWRRVHIGEILDIAAPSLIIAQAIGRWGNFVNQEAYGNVITDPNWTWFPAAVFIDAKQAYYQATFFYESMWNLLVFIFLILIRRKFKFRGAVFALYGVGYGIGRIVIEGLRTDSLYWGQFRVSQLVSALLIVGGLAYVIYMSVKKKESPAYDGLYSASWTPEQVTEFKANIKTIRAQERADKAAKKAEAMLEKNDAAESKVKKAEEKAERAKKQLSKIKADIKISEIQASAIDDGDMTDRERKKAEKAKQKAEKLSAKAESQKEQIDRAEEKIQKAEEKAGKTEMKAKIAEQDAQKKSAKAKKAEIQEQKAKEKAEAAKEKAEKED